MLGYPTSTIIPQVDGLLKDPRVSGRHNGIPISIISDQDPRFASRFWGKLQEALGTRLNFSITFHPKTDGQSERVIQILEDMLRSCVIDYDGS